MTESTAVVQPMLEAEAGAAGIFFISASPATVHATTIDLYQNQVEEYAALFADREQAMKLGFRIGEKEYEVHRWYKEEGLVYGRTSAGGEGDFFCLVQASKGEQQYVLGAIYHPPSVTARVVPAQQQLMARILAALP